MARGRWRLRVQCLEQPPDGKSSPGYGCGEVWSAGGDAQSSPDTQPSASPCILGSLRHVRCSYRKGFIGRYDTYSSCVGDSTGFFWVFVSIVLACSLNAEGRDDLFSFAGHLQSSAAPLLLRLSRPRNQGGVLALGERGRAADRWTWCC